MAKSLILNAAPYTQAGLLDQYAFGWPTGNIWWVHSVTGTDAVAPQGKTPGAPFATVSYAISAATANNDDWIVCMQGHSETITSAAQLNVNKAGLKIVGLGTGRNRPTFNYTTDVAASFDINSANALLRNLVFTLTGVDALTAGINVKAADCTIEDCEIELADSSNQATLGILTTAAANRMIVRRCHLHGSNNAGAATAIRVVGTTDSQILDNIIQGSFTTTIGGINIATTAAVNLMIGRNIIQNLTAVSTKCIVDTITATTGQIWENRMQILSGTAPITAATMSWVGANYYAAALGTAGTLI